jgi:SAM-dependent methyltransferase
MPDDMAFYFEGDKLYGDDFTPEQIKRWHEEESEGYGDLIHQENQDYVYVYHALNRIYGFSRSSIPNQAIALGIGAAYCDEFVPIAQRLERIYSLDPSSRFVISEVAGVPVSHAKPSILGEMPFRDGMFDVVTSFGVLHHIANVTFVLGECHRVLKPGGVMFLREPIVSMGDWRRPRPRATKNERGIPHDLLIDMVRERGFEIASRTLHDFTPLVRILGKAGVPIFARRWSTVLDHIASRTFGFNKTYHRRTIWDRFGPASVFLVLRKI